MALRRYSRLDLKLDHLVILQRTQGPGKTDCLVHKPALPLALLRPRVTLGIHRNRTIGQRLLGLGKDMVACAQQAPLALLGPGNSLDHHYHKINKRSKRTHSLENPQTERTKLHCETEIACGTGAKKLCQRAAQTGRQQVPYCRSRR